MMFSTHSLSVFVHKALVVSGLIVLVTTLSTTQALAQSAESVEKGLRVRLVAPTVSRKPLIGKIVQLDETSIVLRQVSSTEPLVVPRKAITTMEVSSRRRSHAVTGAFIGFAAGAIAVFVTPESSCTGFFCTEPDKAVVAPVIGVLTAVLGAMIGTAFTRSETWTPVPSGLQVSVAPKHRGGVVSVSFAF